MKKAVIRSDIKTGIKVAGFMDFITKEFDDKEIERKKIDKVLRAAMQAPSGMNRQPWEFVVVNDKDILLEMKKYSVGSRALDTAPMAIVILNREEIKRRDMGISLLLSQDLGACTENLWLQAVEEGLGACWMGVIPGSEGQRILSTVLELPNNVTPYAVIAIGYPAEEADIEPVDRYDKTRVHYNKY